MNISFGPLLYLDLVELLGVRPIYITYKLSYGDVEVNIPGPIVSCGELSSYIAQL